MTDPERFVEQPEEATQPPQPPSVKKRFQFTKAQWIGMPVILLIPVLALIGLFDTHSTRVTATVGDLQITVEHPTSVRYKRNEPISIVVQNLSASTFPTVTVAIDNAYINGFSTVTFTPDVDEVTADAFILHLEDVQPNESRRIAIEIQGEHYWGHTGTVTAKATAKATAEVHDTHAEVMISTFVFP